MGKETVHGRVVVHEDQCKGCALCVEACPVHGLQIAASRLNRIGYHPVEFLDCGCTGCGVCFYACPEPGALRVLRLRPGGNGSARAVPSVIVQLADRVSETMASEVRAAGFSSPDDPVPDIDPVSPARRPEP
jgi:NAD-dependent dihydropyrimidine dehydrogenase PreA subunit